MHRKQILIGETYWFYSNRKGKNVLKKAVVVGPWNKDYPEYIGIKDVMAGGFCYIEASRLFRMKEELSSEINRSPALRVLPPVTPIEDTSRGILRASMLENKRCKIRII